MSFQFINRCDYNIQNAELNTSVQHTYTLASRSCRSKHSIQKDTFVYV